MGATSSRLSRVAGGAMLVGGVGAAAYIRSFPRLTVTSGPRDKGKGVASAAAMRVRFAGGPAAQVYYPTSAAADDCATSYPYMRPAALSGLAEAVAKPEWVFKLFGLGSAPTDALTALKTGKPPPLPRETESLLPVVIFSHGLYGHMDLHAALGMSLARAGFVCLVLEHEGRAASYCKTEDGRVLTYLSPPPLTSEAKASYEGYLDFCRDFRAPILAHREREIATVMRSLRGQGPAPRPLTGAGEELLPTMSKSDTDNQIKGHDTAMMAQAASEHLGSLVQRLDLGRVTMAGHSFGGATAVVAAQSELKDLKGAFSSLLLYDPWSEPLTQASLAKGLGSLPTFCLLCEAFSAEAGNKFAGLTEHLLSEQASGTTRAVAAVLPGTKHPWASDVPFWLPQPVARLMQQAGTLDSEVALRETIAASLALLERNEPADVKPEDYQMRTIFQRASL
eukprot:g2798.t1